LLEVLDGQVTTDDLDGLLPGLAQGAIAGSAIGFGLPQRHDPQERTGSICACAHATVAVLGVEYGKHFVTEIVDSRVNVGGALERQYSGVHGVTSPTS
jgi:hypothetical protein